MDQQFLIDETIDNTESAIVELGAVSEKTKGGIWGWSDGGAGQCFC